MDTLPFSHLALARDRPSIRLVQVSPTLSPDGLIQCNVSHHIINESLSYACLSYVWGAPEPAQLILIKGQTFSVRQNLFHFLSLMQTKMSADNMEPIAYWIDALCIDQSNVLERNHQVQQMGRIFSSAACVHIWLGAMPHVKGVGRILRDPDAASMEDWNTVHRLKAYLAANISHNEYWTRAWITQEVLLARDIQVLFDVETLPLSTLLRGFKYFYIPLEGAMLDGGFFMTEELDFIVRRPAHFVSWSLVELADHFRQRKCSIARDHFYSLLSLCKGVPEFAVDYENSASELAYQILRHGTIAPCLCSAMFVLDMLGVEDEIKAGAQNCSMMGPFIEFECRRLIIGCGHSVNQHEAQSGSAGVVRMCEQPYAIVWSSSPFERSFPRKENSVNLKWTGDGCTGDLWTAWQQRLVVSTTSTILRRPGIADPESFIPGSGPWHEVHKDQVEDLPKHWTKYARADGFSARYNETDDIYTIRVAFWALVAWKCDDGRKDVNLCRRYESYERASVHASSGLGVRIGNGSWDLEPDESEVLQ